MATIRRPASGNYEWGQGEFYYELEYSETADSFTCQLKMHITKAFKSGHQLIFNINGNQYKSSADGIKKKETYVSKERTFVAETLTVKCRLDGDTENGTVSFGTIRHSQDISTPNISAKKISNARIRLTVKGNASTTKAVQEIAVERQVDGSAWSAIDFLEGVGTTYTDSYEVTGDDIEIEEGHTYTYRARAVRGSSESFWSANSETIQTIATSADIQNVVATRTGNAVILSWQISALAAIASGNISAFVISRSTNSNTFEVVGDVYATEGASSYSFANQIAKDNVYQYRVSAVNRSGETSALGTESEPIYTTPTEPQSISLSLNSGNFPQLKLANVSHSAQSVEIERSDDGGLSWTSEATEEYPVTEYSSSTAAAQGDSVLFRVRNVGDSSLTASERYSAWVTSGAVSIDTKSKPNPPTLIYPQNGQKFTLDEGSVILKWRHNSIDGSAQESAAITYKVNGASHTATVTTAEEYELPFTGLSAGDVITWSVKTKGAHPSQSDSSTEQTFALLSKPQITWTAPENGDLIDSLPLSLAWNYSDLSGTLESMSLKVKKDGRTIMTKDIPTGSGGSGAYSYILSDFLPDNYASYDLEVTAVSSSGLKAQQTITVSIGFEEISLTGGLLPSVIFDEETGVAIVRLMRDITGGATPLTITGAALYRVHDGETKLVQAGLSEGSAVVDEYAPIRVDYSYKLLQTTASGIGVTEVTFRNESPYFFCYFDGGIAKAKWNPEGNIKVARPEKTEIRYSGREFAVSYDSDAREETFSFSATVFDRGELQAFRNLMRTGGRGIWKSGDGDVYDADFELSYSPIFKDREPRWDISLSITRIEGDSQ